jgi:hypothetical protein
LSPPPLPSTGAGTQDLHLEPLHQAFFVLGFFKIGLENYFVGWLRTTTLLISASWVARITGVSYWRQQDDRVLILLTVIWIYLELLCINWTM